MGASKYDVKRLVDDYVERLAKNGVLPDVMDKTPTVSFFHFFFGISIEQTFFVIVFARGELNYLMSSQKVSLSLTLINTNSDATCHTSGIGNRFAKLSKIPEEAHGSQEWRKEWRKFRELGNNVRFSRRISKK